MPEIILNNKTIPELKELAISFIENGAYHSGIECLKEIIKIKEK